MRDEASWLRAFIAGIGKALATFGFNGPMKGIIAVIYYI